MIRNDWLTIQMCKTTLINKNGDSFYFSVHFKMTYITSIQYFCGSLPFPRRNGDRNSCISNHAKGLILASRVFHRKIVWWMTFTSIDLLDRRKETIKYKVHEMKNVVCVCIYVSMPFHKRKKTKLEKYETKIGLIQWAKCVCVCFAMSFKRMV